MSILTLRPLLVGVLFLVGACSSPVASDPSETLRKVHQEANQSNPQYSKLPPLTLPERIIQAAALGNEAAARLVRWVSELNRTLLVSADPYPGTLMLGPHWEGNPVKPPGYLGSYEPQVVKECTQVGVVTVCTYTWYENQGRLLVRYVATRTPAEYADAVFYDGEWRDWRFMNEPIQFWVTTTDLKTSRYIYFSKFPLCADETLPLLDVARFTEDDVQLCFEGSCEGLATYTWVMTGFTCTPPPYEPSYHPLYMYEVTVYPRVSDISSVFKIYEWSLNEKRLFLWIELVYMRDFRYCITVYDKSGGKYECGNW